MLITVDALMHLLVHTCNNVLFIMPAQRAGAQRATARNRALANFTPIHHWEGGELRSGPDMLLFWEMHFTPFLHDIGEKYLMRPQTAKP